MNGLKALHKNFYDTAVSMKCLQRFMGGWLGNGLSGFLGGLVGGAGGGRGGRRRWVGVCDGARAEGRAESYDDVGSASGGGGR